MEFKEMINDVHEGDCLDIMKLIPDGAIDMILCDLPYGTTRNEWDSIIDLKKLWKEYKRIIKQNGAIVLTGQGLFTAKLIIEGDKLFKYKFVWIKSKATNFLNANKQPLRKHEDICVFYKQQPIYNPQMSIGEPYTKSIRKDKPTGSYDKFKPVNKVSNGERYPTDIIDGYNINDHIYFRTAELEGEVFHPTQKPIELGRYLIKTFTNEGDVVLDNTCGSGSFLIAAKLENRQFIGIEQNHIYVTISKERLNALLVEKNGTIIKETENA
jgi:site-specific DNA-methyltransferase (adenine-specific)